MNIGIYYGSTSGATEGVASSIASAFGADTTCKSITDAAPEDLVSHDILILGSSTWGDGELQDDWNAFLPKLDSIDLTGKTVALFGVGDQFGWADTFVDAIGILYEKVVTRGGRVVGHTSTEGYVFNESKAVVEGKFVGLVLDETNQAAETAGRITAWVEAIRASL